MNTSWAILWDMDGVIVDSARLHFLSWVDALARHGINFTPEMFSHVFGKNNTSIIRDLIPSANRDLIETIDSEKESFFRKNIQSNADIFDGVLHWLTRFLSSGFPQAVASSAPMANLDALVDAFNIRPYFQVLVSGQFLPSKPDPTVFQQAARQLGYPENRCVVIEDSIHGIQGARKAGMKTIAVATSQPQEALQMADLVVNRLIDLNDNMLKILLN